METNILAKKSGLSEAYVFNTTLFDNGLDPFARSEESKDDPRAKEQERLLTLEGLKI